MVALLVVADLRLGVNFCRLGIGLRTGLSLIRRTSRRISILFVFISHYLPGSGWSFYLVRVCAILLLGHGRRVGSTGGVCGVLHLHAICREMDPLFVRLRVENEYQKRLGTLFAEMLHRLEVTNVVAVHLLALSKKSAPVVMCAQSVLLLLLISF